MASPASLLKAILNVKEVVFLNADTQSVYMGMTGRLLATAFAARSIRSNWIKTAILKRL